MSEAWLFKGQNYLLLFHTVGRLKGWLRLSEKHDQQCNNNNNIIIISSVGGMKHNFNFFLSLIISFAVTQMILESFFVSGYVFICQPPRYPFQDSPSIVFVSRVWNFLGSVTFLD